MMDMNKLCEVIESELTKISEKGLNTGNIENAYKLIDMYKDLKNTEYWDIKTEYYMAMLEDMQSGGYSHNDGYSMDGSYNQGGYSERRKRDSRGRYSRANGGMGGSSYEVGGSYRGGGNYSGRYSREGGYSRDGGYSGNDDRYNRYMESKQSFRSNKSGEYKQKLMDTLEEYMDDFTRQMEEMARDSDCAEEKDTIMKYLRKLQNIR